MFDMAGVPFAVTLERTFGLENRVVVPSGISRCFKTHYNKGGYDTFEIAVPGHFRVLFHTLNLEEQSEGCIGIGEFFDIFNGKPGIAASRKAFEEFWSKYGHFSEIQLEVKEYFVSNDSRGGPDPEATIPQSSVTVSKS